MPPGLNYFNKVIEFWGRKIPIVKTTLQNTLDCIHKKKKITDKTALDQYGKTEFLLPTAKLLALPTWRLTSTWPRYQLGH